MNEKFRKFGMEIGLLQKKNPDCWVGMSNKTKLFFIIILF